MNKVSVIFSSVILLFWLISGLYLSSGGISKIENYNYIKSNMGSADTVKVIYESTIYENQAHLQSSLEDQEMSKVFPWLDKLPSYILYIFTACSFGLLGAVVRLFIQLVIDEKSILELKIFTLPILGMLTGLVVLGISLVFPSIIINSERDIKASGLMFLCLFSGIFVEQFYKSIFRLFTKLFDK